jgi:TRAP-type C4-dicarboxylate transport system permease small subunit
MMIIMTADVLARYFLQMSLLGTYELAENFLVVIVAFSLANTQVIKRHIHVDVLTNIMPRKMRDVVDALCMIISAVFVGLCAYAQYQQTIDVRATGTATTVLMIKLWPFNLWLANGMTLFFLAICVDCINDIRDLFRSGGESAEAEERA